MNSSANLKLESPEPMAPMVNPPLSHATIFGALQILKRHVGRGDPDGYYEEMLARIENDLDRLCWLAYWDSTEGELMNLNLTGPEERNYEFIFAKCNEHSLTIPWAQAFAVNVSGSVDFSGHYLYYPEGYMLVQRMDRSSHFSESTSKHDVYFKHLSMDHAVLDESVHMYELMPFGKPDGNPANEKPLEPRTHWQTVGLR